MPRTRRPSPGFTLLEVLLALAILGGSLAVIGASVNVSLRNIERVRNEVRATVVAESVLAEVTAGILLPETVTGASYLDDPNWLYSVEVEQGDATGLLAVKVTVQRNVGETEEGYPVTLSRWLVDPIVAAQEEADLQAKLDEATAKAAAASETSASGGGSSGSGASGGGTGGN